MKERRGFSSWRERVNRGKILLLPGEESNPNPVKTGLVGCNGFISSADKKNLGAGPMKTIL